jgi:hypothetical protein
MKRLLLFITLTIFLGACAKREIKVQVMRPALITVPKEIQKIAILNRSIPTNKAAMEGILTGETPARDKELSEECIRGLSETLNTSNRFQVFRCDSTMFAADPASLSFGAPLGWDVVDSICTLYNVDGLLVLEYFDTDFSVTNPVGAATQVAQSVARGGQGGVSITGTATANAGFRVYYSKTKTIAYEDRFDYKKRWRQNSVSAAEAIGKMIKRNRALIEVSYETGYEFAMNIVPLYYWENRIMLRGKKELEKGERQALSKDWEGALITWTNVYENSRKAKDRAKAAHNAGLACEVLGKLNEAQQWLSKGYIEKGKKETLRYSEIIDKRIREQSKLEEQLNNVESEE